MEELFSCVTYKAVALIPALIVIGKIVKSVPAVPCWLIPVILLLPGVAGTMLLAGWSVESAIQGVLVTGAAVYGNQIWKQVVYKSDVNIKNKNDRGYKK